MCIALPARVTSIGEPVGRSLPAVVRVGDTERPADLAMVPHAVVGDYVLVHAGFAVGIVPEGSARETLELAGLAEAGGEARR